MEETIKELEAEIESLKEERRELDERLDEFVSAVKEIQSIIRSL